MKHTGVEEWHNYSDEVKGRAGITSYLLSTTLRLETARIRSDGDFHAAAVAAVIIAGPSGRPLVLVMF